MGEHLLSVAGPFVGRAHELRLLDAAGAAAAGGHGSVTVVSGEAGIGKTRLCSEAVVRARAAGLTVVSGRCWLDGGAPALWPWQQILDDLCGDDTSRLLGADHGRDTVDPDRFARFAAITSRLATVSGRAPVYLVVDDVHAADAGTLLLLRFVTRSLPRLRMAIVLSRRLGGVAAGSLEERLLDDIEAEATPIVLRHLDDTEATAFLATHGLDDLDPSLAAAMVRLSGGNPLFLRRIAALGTPDPGRAIPGGLQVAIEQSVRGLGERTQRVLRAAAVLGLTPSVDEVAVVAGLVAGAGDGTRPGDGVGAGSGDGHGDGDRVGAGAAAVLDAATEAAAAGLVDLVGTDRFDFVHELVRATFEAGLGAAERLDVHARAAPAVAGEGPSTPVDRLARRAHHALAAAPRSLDDRRRAVDACRAAAQSMVAGFAYEKADALLSSAVGLHDGAGLGPPPVRLLVEWAQAALLCGRLADARGRFDRAATAAEQQDDAFSFAEAALGLGGHWVNEHREPFERARVLGLQRSALARLPSAPGAGTGGRPGASGLGSAAADIEPGGPGGPGGGTSAVGSVGGPGVAAAGAADVAGPGVGSEIVAADGVGGPAGAGVGAAGVEPEGVGAGEVGEALRVRLEARLAAEAVYAGGDLEPVLVALARAHECDDLGARAEALSLCHHALLAPEHAAERLALADELVAVASEAGHGVLGLMGLCWRAVDLFLLGDPRARRALEDLRQRSDALACQNILYIVDVIDVMRLARAGRLADAEDAANRCYDLGDAVGEVDTFAYLAAHLVAIRWIQGRDEELLDTAEAAATSSTLVQAEFAFHAMVALIAARSGHPDRARTWLDPLTAAGLTALPRSSTWLVGMAAIAEAAATMDDAAVTREAYDQLLPYADRPVMPSLAVMCLGSTERFLGVAALTFGDVDLAVAHLRRALAANRRLANLPLVAITQADLAQALLHRSGPAAAAVEPTDPRAALDPSGGTGAGADPVALLRQAQFSDDDSHGARPKGERGEAGTEVDEALDLFDEAIEAARSMGMERRAAVWEAERVAVAPAPEVRRIASASASPSGDAARAARVGVMRREGRGWLVAVADHRVFVPDLVGVRYLAELLRHPGQPVAAVALAGAGVVPPEASHHEVLDDHARAAFLARARELTEDLTEAEAHADLARAEKLRAELDALVDQLEAATGLHGRPRTFPNQAERARTAVRKAIKRAVDEIDALDPVVGAALRTTITTGTTCTYTPDRHTPTTWTV